MIRPDISFSHEFCWEDLRSPTSGTLDTPISGQSLCYAYGYCGTSAVNLFSMFSAVRVTHISIIDRSEDPTQTETIGITYCATVNGVAIPGGSGRFYKDVTSNAEVTEFAMRPPPKYLMGNWLSAADTTIAAYVRTTPGAVVRIRMQCYLNDGPTLASAYGIVASTLDSVGFAPLDLATAAGSRQLFAVGPYWKFQ